MTGTSGRSERFYINEYLSQYSHTPHTHEYVKLMVKKITPLEMGVLFSFSFLHTFH